MKKQNKNLKKTLSVLIAALGLGTAQAAWRFVDGKLTNDNPRCSFPAQVVTLTDGAGNNITGLQLTGKNEESTKKIDFTDVAKDTGHKVISASAEALARNCREFIAPDMFDLSERMFKDATTYGVYVTNIVISPNVVRFPKQWAQQTPLKTLKPEKFPYVKSFEDKCFSSCTNFQVDVGQLIDPGVTNIGTQAFYNVPVKGALYVTNLCHLGEMAFAFFRLSTVKGKYSNLESVKLAGPLEEIPLQGFRYAYSLKEVDLSGCLSLRSIKNEAFHGCCSLASDVARVVNPAVTNIGDFAFANTAIAGKLVLTNAQYIGPSAFYVGHDDIAKKYEREARLTAIDLSGSQMKILHGAFGNQNTLKSFVSGARSLDIIGSQGNPFAECTSLTNIWIKGPALTQQEMDWLGAYVQIYYPCIIYASTNLPPANASRTNWMGLATNATPEELEKLSGLNRTNCFGVYQTKKGKRKAFFVHRRSPFEDKDGVMIIVR